MKTSDKTALFICIVACLQGPSGGQKGEKGEPGEAGKRVGSLQLTHKHKHIQAGFESCGSQRDPSSRKERFDLRTSVEVANPSPTAILSIINNAF